MQLNSKNHGLHTPKLDVTQGTPTLRDTTWVGCEAVTLLDATNRGVNQNAEYHHLTAVMRNIKCN